MCACAILHNIIIKDEFRGKYDVDNYEIVESSIAATTITLEAPTSFAVILNPY
jgi:hypothetical protein